MPADRNTKIVTRNFGVENANRIDVALQRGAYARRHGTHFGPGPYNASTAR